MKLNRFQKQEYSKGVQFEEMEASLASFLSEIEDENTKLLESVKKEMALVEGRIKKQTANNKKDSLMNSQDIPIEKAVNAEGSKNKQPIDEQDGSVTYSAPKAYVKNAYHAQKKEQPVQTVEQRVHEMYVRGKSTETIAKELGKGKTEVELLLKFNNKNT